MLKRFLFARLTFSRSKTSYSFTPSNQHLTPITIGQLLDERARDSADKIACISHHQNISKTYQQLNEDVSSIFSIFCKFSDNLIFQVNKLAKGLEKLGCKKGDRVGIWSPNSYEWILTQYATAKIGSILV